MAARASGDGKEATKITLLLQCDTCKLCRALALCSTCLKIKCENCAGVGWLEQWSGESIKPERLVRCLTCDGKKELLAPCVQCVACAKALAEKFDAYNAASVNERNEEDERRWVLFMKAKHAWEKKQLAYVELSGCELLK
jgi:hypothetical protein